MRLSSVGPNTIIEAMDPERTDPPVQAEGVPAPQASQLETESQNKRPTQMPIGNLTNLIEEAKKRADIRKKKGNMLRRNAVISAYRRRVEFEELLTEIGGSLDEST